MGDKRREERGSGVNRPSRKEWLEGKGGGGAGRDTRHKGCSLQPWEAQRMRTARKKPTFPGYLLCGVVWQTRSYPCYCLQLSETNILQRRYLEIQ